MPTYKRSTRNRNRTRNRTRTHNRGGGGPTIVERIQKRMFGENEKLKAQIKQLQTSVNKTNTDLERLRGQNKTLLARGEKQARNAMNLANQLATAKQRTVWAGITGLGAGALAGTTGTVLTRRFQDRESAIIPNIIKACTDFLTKHYPDDDTPDEKLTELIKTIQYKEEHNFTLTGKLEILNLRSHLKYIQHLKSQKECPNGKKPFHATIKKILGNVNKGYTIEKVDEQSSTTNSA